MSTVRMLADGRNEDMRSAPFALIALAAIAASTAARPQPAEAPSANASRLSAAHIRRLRRPGVKRSAAPVAPPAPPPAMSLRPADPPLGPPARAGWFKTESRIGWGRDKDGEETVLGVYTRPAEPGIPGPQTYHTPESRSAAGLSLSFKLQD